MFLYLSFLSFYLHESPEPSTKRLYFISAIHLKANQLGSSHQPLNSSSYNRAKQNLHYLSYSTLRWVWRALNENFRSLKEIYKTRRRTKFCPALCPLNRHIPTAVYNQIFLSRNIQRHFILDLWKVLCSKKGIFWFFQVSALSSKSFQHRYKRFVLLKLCKNSNNALQLKVSFTLLDVFRTLVSSKHSELFILIV